MSDFSIDFAAVSPDDVSAKISAIFKILDLAKIAQIKQVDAVINFLHVVAEKPVTAKIIAVLIEAWSVKWSQDVAVLMSELKN